MTGRVLGREGWPVPGVRVTLIGPTGAQLAVAVSGADGEFDFPTVPPGPATMLVAGAGFDPQAHAVTIPAGQWSPGTIRVARTGAPDLPEPGVWVLDPDHSSVSAQARHLGLATVRGHFTDFGGAVTVAERFEASRVHVAIEAASISTRNEQRDAHLRSADFLDVEAHPTITYVGDRVERRGSGWVVLGRLTMAGTTRPVDLDMTFEGANPDPWGGVRAGFSATAHLRREDFAMNWNQAVALGLDVLGTTLRVDLAVEAVRRA